MASEKSNTRPDANPAKGKWFVTTSWTNLMRARKGDSPEASEALEQLCGTYWYPLYAYVRRLGYPPQDAEDLTQAFFCVLLEKNYLGAADRKRGKFRSFLLSSLHHFLSNRWDYENAAKRGGGKTIISLDEQPPEDRYALEPADALSPETIFERRWAMTVMDQSMERLERESEAAGKVDQFRLLKPYVTQEAASGEYNPVAAALEMSAGAVAVAVHRLRQRYGELVREEVTRTVASAAEVDAEMRHLQEVLSGMRF